MRTTVIRVSRQSPRLLLALRPSELDALVRALQAARRDPDQSVYLSVAGEQGQPLTEVEIYLDETDRARPWSPGSRTPGPWARSGRARRPEIIPIPPCGILSEEVRLQP